MSPTELEQRIGREMRSRGFDDDSLHRAGTSNADHSDCHRTRRHAGKRCDRTDQRGAARRVDELDRLLKQIEEEIGTIAGARGRSIRRASRPSSPTSSRRFRARRPTPKVKRLIVQVLEDTNRSRIKTGWFRNWYANLKHRTRHVVS